MATKIGQPESEIKTAGHVVGATKDRSVKMRKLEESDVPVLEAELAESDYKIVRDIMKVAASKHRVGSKMITWEAKEVKAPNGSMVPIIRLHLPHGAVWGKKGQKFNSEQVLEQLVSHINNSAELKTVKADIDSAKTPGNRKDVIYNPKLGTDSIVIRPRTQLYDAFDSLKEQLEINVPPFASPERNNWVAKVHPKNSGNGQQIG